MTPYEEGVEAKNILDNPYWKEYPKPSRLGGQDEINARFFVDGWVSKWSQS